MGFAPGIVTEPEQKNESLSRSMRFSSKAEALVITLNTEPGS